MKNLKDRAYYENRYDKLVVDICRDIESRIPPKWDLFTFTIDKKKKKDAKQETKKEKKEQELCALYFYNSLYLYMRRIDLQEKRDECVSKWMKEDEERDIFFETTPDPGTQYCHQCNIPMSFFHKTLMSWIVKKEKDRIVFFYTCPRCKYRRGVYNNGKELEPIVIICEKCGGKDVKLSTESKKNGDYTIKETCQKCGHEKKNKHKYLKEKLDPNYETDRRRYIMTNQEVLEFHIWQKNAESILGKREERINNQVKL